MAELGQTTAVPFGGRFGSAPMDNPFAQRLAVRQAYDSNGVAFGARLGAGAGSSVEPREGIVNGFVDGIREMISGSYHVAGASAGELLTLLGANSIITWDDLTQKDIKGALMMAAMVSGGVAGAAATKLPMVAAAAAQTGARGVIARAAATAMTEAVAGAGFGMIRPLEAGEERYSAALGDAAFGAALGAGFSFARSGIRATLGGRIAAIKSAGERMELAKLAQNFSEEQTAREVLGVQLHIPGQELAPGVRTQPQQIASVRKQANGKTRVSITDMVEGRRQKSFIDEWVDPERGGGDVQHLEFSEFNEALRWAAERGFTEQGVSYRAAVPKAERALLGEDLLARLDGGEALGQLDLQGYRSWRNAHQLREEAQEELAAVAAEAAAPSDSLGLPKLPQREKKAIAAELGIGPAELVRMSDGDVLRAAVKGGVIDFEHLPLGMNNELAMREVVLNGADGIGDLGVRVVSSTSDSVLSKVLTSNMIEKLHPIVTPLVESAKVRQTAQAARLVGVRQRLSNLRLEVSPEAAERAAALIDDAGNLATEVAEQPGVMDAWRAVYGVDGAADSEVVVRAARARALQEASALGDQEVLRFVDEVTEMLEGYRSELIQLGKLEVGMPGYFPIVNGNRWALQVDGEIIDFFPTRREALETFAKGGYEGKNASIAPNTWWFDGDGQGITPVDPKVFGKFVKVMKESAEEEMSWDEARALVSGGGVVPASGTRSNRRSGNLRKRALGVRDFSVPAHDAIEMYAHQMERFISLEAAPESLMQSLATRMAPRGPAPLEAVQGPMGAPLLARSLEADSKAVIDAIPRGHSALRAWAQQLVDDSYGRPRRAELWVDNVIKTMGIDAKPLAMRRLSAGIRRFESFSRLGGFFSGIVNLTQLPINGGAKLGADVFRALPILVPGRFGNATRELIKYGVPAEMLAADVTEEGVQGLARTIAGNVEGSVPADSIRAAFLHKNYLDAMYKMSLYVFNGAEKVNRTAVGWATYKKQLASISGREITDLDRREAARLAKEMIETTQFDYTLANTPEILRHPAGAVAFQFKSFVINELEFLSALTTPEWIRFGTAVWALGGAAALMNVPGADMLSAASGIVTGQRIDEMLKSADTQTPGFDRLKRAAIFGVPGSLAGIDLSDYIGVSGMRDIMRGLWGPGPRDAANLSKFVMTAVGDVIASGHVAEETTNAVLQQLLPSMVRRGMNAQAVWNTGEVRNPYNGKLVYRPVDRGAEARRVFVGAPSIRTQQERIAEELTTRARERYIRVHNSFAKDAARAVRNGDGNEARRVLAEATAEGYPIEPRSLQFWVQELGRTGVERRIRRTAKSQREELADMLSATGTLRPEELGLSP